jgi:uncharacterized protein
MSHNQSWYTQGLSFRCTECGACCTGVGSVRISVQDLENMALYKKMSINDFVEYYVIRTQGSWVLKEGALHGDCIFLQDKHCSIYQARPTQCRTFPWWPSVLHSAQSWQEAARSCEGIDNQEDHTYSWEKIQELLAIDKADRRQR